MLRIEDATGVLNVSHAHNQEDISSGDQGNAINVAALRTEL